MICQRSREGTSRPKVPAWSRGEKKGEARRRLSKKKFDGKIPRGIMMGERSLTIPGQPIKGGGLPETTKNSGEFSLKNGKAS